QELVNYRTDRASGKASIPWFHVAIGARQTSLMTGICLSKQSWKLELQKSGTEKYNDEESGEERERDVWKPYIDRPDCQLIPPECFVIDPAADWTNPAQNASYIIIKWPMRIDEIRRKQKDPRNPWKEVPEEVLRASGEVAQAENIRRAREQGIDRMDKANTTSHFDVIWVWETYIRTAGEDWTFISVGDKTMLTDPKPVRDVYPEQMGERPLAMGYGAFEAFRIFPMSSVESWQMLQQEANDIRNLSLDSIKQNVMPVTKVIRGRNVDLEQLKRRGTGSAIMVTNKDDVTWEKVNDITAGVQAMTQKLDIEFDDLAGQQNYGTVADNNALGKTLGGLKLAAGAANAVQEFDIRIWIETWCEPVLSQIVRLEQFYESDPVVLGICGERAKLLQKFGVNEIDDELLENNVTIRVNVGLGAGDPQQRLAKFNSAVQVALPLLQMDPDFATGKKKIDGEAVMQEVFGGAGYRDGGKRFVKDGAPQQADPAAQAAAAAEGEEKMASAKLKGAQADKAKTDAKVAIMNALTNAAKVGLDLKSMGFDQSIAHMDQVGKAMELGHSQGLALKAAKMAAKGLNVDGTPIDMPGTPPGPDYPDGKVPPEVLGSMPGGVAPESGPQMGGEPADPGLDPTPTPAPAAPQRETFPDGSPLPPTGPKPEPAAAAPAGPKKARRRTVSIGKRGPDGKPAEYHITDED
ncbi:MAG TPA: hypothetical protein VFS91_01510, partial [Nitrobacter sp.]|nr:hypothetical protein [Nitrobacter sp.]